MLPNAPENKALAEPGPSLSENERALAGNNAAILKGRNALHAEWRFLHDRLWEAAAILEAVGKTAAAEELRQCAQDSVERVGSVVSPPDRKN